MRAVNLLPIQAVVEKKTVPGWAPYAGAALVPVIALNLVFMGYTNAHSALKDQNAQLVMAQSNVAKLAPAKAATAPDLSILVAARTAREAALTDVLSKEVDWSKTLGDVARVLPGSVWLTTLNASAPTPADSAIAAVPVTTPPVAGTTTAPSGFTMSGYALTANDVALLLERLQLLPTLSSVTLGQTQQTLMGTKPVVQFQITASLTPTPVEKTTTP